LGDPPANAAVLDPKLVEAQGQIVAGNLDAGLRALAEVRGKPGADIGPQSAFVEKLVAVRVAERLGDQAKVSGGLSEAIKQAGQQEQVAACWQLGLNLAQAAVAAKSPAANGLMEFLSAQAAPALRQFDPHLEIAKLRMAAGQAGAAEAELSQAAALIVSPENRGAWIAAVVDLARLVDGGQAPQAGIDLFVRLRKATSVLPVQVALDVAEARMLLDRGELFAVADVVKRAAVSVKTAKADTLAVLTLSYDLAAALQKAGKLANAKTALADAEALALALPPSAEAIAMRCCGLTANGRADLATEVAWNAALAAKQPAERQQILLVYASAAVAAGREGEIVARLQTMKAPTAIFTAAAVSMAQAGKAEAAMTALEAVPPQAIVADTKAAGDVATVVQRIREQQQHTAARQADRCRAVAGEFTSAAKRAETAKDAKAASEAAKQAAAFQALAAQGQK